MKTFVLILLVACIVTVTWADSDDGDHLLGRPDGHEQRTGDEPMIGRPDGHEPRPSTETPLIGRPDGHEPRPATDTPLIGRPDGHEPTEPTNTDDEAADNSEEELGPDDYYVERDFSVHDSYEEGGPETENPDPTVNATEHPDGHEPLVRCKRPICEMACDMGFKLDSLGCQICECSDAPSKMPCPEPMCANYCPAGYKNNAAGCMTCDCVDSENHGPLEQAQTMPTVSEEPLIRCKRPMCMMYCTAGFELDSNGCPLCQCRHGLACPEPMCANYCPAGYKKNAAGCTVCECVEIPAERQCEGTVCLEGQVCRNRTNSDGAISRTCSVKTLCEKARSAIARPRLGQVVPQCEADGSYSSVQCSGSTAHCWCVDGRGQEIAGSNRNMMNGEEPPFCARNVSLSMHIHMTLYIYHDVDLSDDMDTLNTTIIDHVSSWLTIDPHFILLTKADPIGFDEGDQSDDSSEEEYDYDSNSEPRTVVVEMIVIHDGSTDLLSASDYMQHRIEQGDCGIPIGGTEMKPKANTVDVRHEFIIDDTCNLPTKKPSCVQWLLRTGRGHIVLCVSTVTLFTLLVVATIYVCCRRRHRGSFAFKHQRLDHQDSTSTCNSDKTLLKSNEYVESPELLTKEKLPIV